MTQLKNNPMTNFVSTERTIKGEPRGRAMKDT